MGPRPRVSPCEIDEARVLESGAGKSLDIEARLTPEDGGRVFLRVLTNPDGSESTEVGHDGLNRGCTSPANEPACAPGPTRAPTG